MSQETEPRNNLIVLYGALSVLAVTILTGALILLFAHTASTEVKARVEQAPTETLNAVRAKEAEMLSVPSYNAQEKVARISIDTAMSLEARDPWHPKATPLPSPVATPAAANASATNTATSATQSPANSPAPKAEAGNAHGH